MSLNKKIDLHMHTTASDGTDNAEEILSRVKEAGISTFSVTDHDSINGCLSVKKLLKKGDPEFISGVEFSCVDEEGKYHILGYGYDAEAASFRSLLDACHAFRIRRVKMRLDFIKKHFDFDFSEEDKEKIFVLDNPGKPHIANLMVKYGYAPSKEEAIKKYLNKYSNAEHRIPPKFAINAIIDAGGIPVLAHPSFGSGEEFVAGSDMDYRLKKLMSYGLLGLEAFYSGFEKPLTEELLAFADKYNLYVTAGSDYHGKNKTVILGDTHLDPDEQPEGLRRFLQDVGKE